MRIERVSRQRCGRRSNPTRVGDLFTYIFTDNGLLWRDEARNILALFREKFGLRLDFSDSTEKFLHALASVTNR